MTKIFNYFFDKGWKQILFFCLATGIFVKFTSNDMYLLYRLNLFLFGLGITMLIMSQIYQPHEKRWLKSILTTVVIITTINFLLLYSVNKFLEAQFKPDHFADNLKIPSNLEIEDPKSYASFKESRPDNQTNKNAQLTDFMLYSDFQPGLFNFDFWTGKIENGTIYLKAFEITHNHALSTSRLLKSSTVKIFNPTDSIIRFSTTSYLTIFEGDFGKPYAARFEVWFKPDTGGAERKLFEKNYRIEGWQM